MQTEAFPVNPHLINNQVHNKDSNNVKLQQSINENNSGPKEKVAIPKNVRYKKSFLK